MVNKSLGFTLIEILVTLFLISGGILGLAATQAFSLNTNLSAYNRSQATFLAYDIADRMRANLVEARKFNTSTYLTSITPAYTAVQQNDCLTESAGCTPANMAQEDLFEWFTQVSSTLPGCRDSAINDKCTSITVNNASNGFIITINWDDNRDGHIDENDPIFQVNILL